MLWRLTVQLYVCEFVAYNIYISTRTLKYLQIPMYKYNNIKAHQRVYKYNHCTRIGFSHAFVFVEKFYSSLFVFSKHIVVFTIVSKLNSNNSYSYSSMFRYNNIVEFIPLCHLVTVEKIFATANGPSHRTNIH